MLWTTLKEKGRKCLGKARVPGSWGGGGRPGRGGFLVRCRREEDGPEVLNEPFQAPVSNAGREKFRSSRKGQSLILSAEVDGALYKPSELWRRVGVPVGSTEAEAAPAAALATAAAAAAAPALLGERRCRCDRGGRGWSSRRLQRAGAAEPCLDAQSRH